MSTLLDACAIEEAAMTAAAMSVRTMTAADVDTAREWLNSRMRQKDESAAVFPAEWLPVTGLSAWQNDRLLAVAILYLERSSPVAVCGWCITDPDNAPGTSCKAVKFLMSAMPLYARQKGAKYLLSTFGNRGINRILDEIGFTTAEKAENKVLIL